MADQACVEERFQRAAERMRANTGLSLSNEEKLELYGHYKQVLHGDDVVRNIQSVPFMDYSSPGDRGTL